MRRRDLWKTMPALAAAGAWAAPAGRAAAKPRLRTAICAYSFREALGKKTMTYDDLVPLAVETEADGLDLTVYWFPEPPADDFLFALKRRAYKAGVEIYSISIRTDMCRPTREQQDAEFAVVRKWVDVAAKLGAGHIRVFGGKVPDGATEDQAAGYATEVLKRCAEYSSKKGVILGLENHGGITEKAERIIQIVKGVDSPWVGINLDTGNFNRNVFPQIEMCIPYAVNVQVKAEMRLEDGTRGPGDWDRVAGMLVKHGYRGYLALEYESKESPDTAVPRLMKKLREVADRHSA